MLVGVYRNVFLASRWVIKIPRLDNFSRGARCNRWEAEIWRKWRPHFGWAHLCPVRICAPFGIVIVMDRASQPVTFEQVKYANDHEYSNYYPKVDIEYKPENWGILLGKVVCVDYGIDDSELILEKRNYYQQKVSAK